jgi:hypothetical protein
MFSFYFRNTVRFLYNAPPDQRYVNKINNHPIGAGVLLPAYVSNKPGLNNLTGGSNGAYTDNLCFSRSPAVDLKSLM